MMYSLHPASRIETSFGLALKTLGATYHHELSTIVEHIAGDLKGAGNAGTQWDDVLGVVSNFGNILVRIGAIYQCGVLPLSYCLHSGFKKNGGEL